jgi:hypothetical protein
MKDEDGLDHQTTIPDLIENTISGEKNHIWVRNSLSAPRTCGGAVGTRLALPVLEERRVV